MKRKRDNITNLWYADDIVLLASSKEKLQNILRKLKYASENYDIKINRSKIKLYIESKIIN